MAKQKSERKVPEISAADAHRLARIANTAATHFRGDFGELESAIGMLFLGPLVGWRVLILIHNKRTIKKYEHILGIEIREEFPETGPLTDKSVGYQLAQKLNAFWKAVAGEIPLEGRRELGRG
ncbi:MAG: hypothetical protein ACREVC_09415 [Burkholderiales bacterium]